MKVRGIDIQGDWLFGKGKSDYKRDRNALAQNIKTRLQCFLGDCFFDLPAGIDWFNLLGSKRVLELRLSISSLLLNTYGVERVNEVTVRTDENRIITVTYSVDSIYGTLQDNINQGVL